MITTDKALKLIANATKSFGTQSVPLSESIGCVLAEDWYADRDFPPYDRVTMDGIAISFNSYVKGQRQFKIEAIAPAGAPQVELMISDESCIEVMTGSIMPSNADTVIRYEDLEISEGLAKIAVEIVKEKQNVHFKGEDQKQGDVLVKKGTLIRSPEIGVGASIGKTEVLIKTLPRCIVVSTGDELVNIDEKPLPHQIRKSNVYRLETTLKKEGLQVDTAHLLDDLESIKSKLEEFVQKYDVLILSGGVSKGKFDFLPEALEAIGVKKLFHRVKQRPGKPLWFGHHPEGATIFALPGNPVSSFMCLRRYFFFWLEKCLELEAKKSVAILGKDFNFKPNLTYFLQVRLEFNEEGKIIAWPKQGHGSGDLTSMVYADAFLELPKGRDQFKKGEVFNCYPFK